MQVYVLVGGPFDGRKVTTEGDEVADSLTFNEAGNACEVVVEVEHQARRNAPLAGGWLLDEPDPLPPGSQVHRASRPSTYHRTRFTSVDGSAVYAFADLPPVAPGVSEAHHAGEGDQE